MTVEFPGFFDVQVNGFGGVDFNAPDVTPDDVHRATAALRRTGVTRYLPTLITGPLDLFERNARLLAAIDDPAIAGIHMEGPYICAVDGPRGAHPKAHCGAASRDDYLRREEAAGGRLRLVTLAPEVDGALDLIEFMAGRGIRVAIGHSDAPPERIEEAVRAGATLSTHLGNGCASMLPRHHNVIWSQLAQDGLHASLIADGHHLPPALVKVIVRAKPRGRTILTTDAMSAAGCGPGRYRIGELEVEIGEDRRPALRGTTFLAGSALSLDAAVGNVVRFTGLPLEDVLEMASAVPARYLGLQTAGTVTADWDQSASRLTIRGVAA